MKPDEIAQNFANIKFMILVSFVLLTVMMIIGIAIITSSNDLGCAVKPVERIYACEEFVEDTKPVFTTNMTELNELCSDYCRIETYYNKEDFDDCKEWCVGEDKFIKMARYVSGNKTVYKCTK